MDLDSGGIVSPMADPNNANNGLSYKVDYLRGTIAFGSPSLPAPTGPQSLAQTISIYLPDANNTLQTGVNPAGRNFRVFYQAHNDWAVQVFKAPQRFTQVLGMPLGVGQFYVGGSGPAGGAPTHIYFPWADFGDKVTIREIWYRDGANRLNVLRDADFVVRKAGPANPFGLPQIDIREGDPNAVAFDFNTYGYAVRGIAGSSVRARVIWNNADKEDVPGDAAADIAQRMDLHEAWTRNWRIVEVESHLTRRDRN
jgi:hypothetical protein